MIGQNLVRLLSAAGSREFPRIVDHCSKLPKGTRARIELRAESEQVRTIRSLQANELAGFVEVEVLESGIAMGELGSTLFTKLIVSLPADLVTEFRDDLLRESRS